MELDVRGMVCPQPVAVVRRCLAELEPGAELVVTGDYPPAERTIRRTCYKHGFAVSRSEPSSTSDDDETFSLRIRVTDEGAQSITRDSRA